MTGPQRAPAPKPDNVRPWLVLVFMFAAGWNLVRFVVNDFDYDQLAIAVLFVVVALDTRAIGMYRRRLGLDL